MISDADNNFMQTIFNKWRRYKNILPNQKKIFGIIYNLFNWSRHDLNCKFKINYENVFLYDIKHINIGLFAIETLE